MKFLNSKIITPVSTGEFNRLFGESLNKIPSKRGKIYTNTAMNYSG